MADTNMKFLVKDSGDVLTFGSTSFPQKFLKASLPDVETVLFFAEVYELKPDELAMLLHAVMPSKVIDALTAQADEHSSTLQDFLVEQYWDDSDQTWKLDIPDPVDGVVGKMAPVQAEILPQMWKSIELEIAESIAKVAEKLRDTVAHMPGRTGEMFFKSLAVMNSKRPTIGEHRAVIQHKPIKQVLVVLDVSGSMTEPTITTIIDDTVGLGYEANASFATVSNRMTFWEPGSYNTKLVLEAAEYGGTHYETLAPLFERDWDVVVCIADYDSSYGAKDALARCSGRIGQVFDISLVNRSTFLAECVGQLADHVQPLLISQPGVMPGGYW